MITGSTDGLLRVWDIEPLWNESATRREPVEAGNDLLVPEAQQTPFVPPLDAELLDVDADAAAGAWTAAANAADRSSAVQYMGSVQRRNGRGRVARLLFSPDDDSLLVCQPAGVKQIEFFLQRDEHAVKVRRRRRLARERVRKERLAAEAKKKGAWAEDDDDDNDDDNDNKKAESKKKEDKKKKQKKKNKKQSEDSDSDSNDNDDAFEHDDAMSDDENDADAAAKEEQNDDDDDDEQDNDRLTVASDEFSALCQLETPHRVSGVDVWGRIDRGDMTTRQRRRDQLQVLVSLRNNSLLSYASAAPNDEESDASVSGGGEKPARDEDQFHDKDENGESVLRLAEQYLVDLVILIVSHSFF